jgi:hypothetical protein
LIETFVAFVVFQVSVTDAPLRTELGLTVNASHRGTTTSGTIVTGTEQVFVSVPRVAVSINVVFALTYTARDPRAATVPTPLLIETSVAFEVVHVSVVVPGALSVPGAAVKASQEIGSGSFTVMVRTQSVPPWMFDAMSV